MARTLRLALAAAALAACTSNQTKLERTWQHFEHRRVEVMERATAATQAEVARGVEPENPALGPAGQVVGITAYGCIAYLAGDLAGLEHAVQRLEDCDRTIVAAR